MSGQAAGNEGRSGTIVEAQEKGSELVSRAQEEVQQKTAELRVEAGSRLREQIDSRSTEVGRQIQSVGEALNRSSDQLRTEHEDTPAELVDQVARRAEEFGGYLESVNADRMLSDIEDLPPATLARGQRGIARRVRCVTVPESVERAALRVER